MKKIQQFWIMSLREEQLRNAEYDLSLPFHAAEAAEKAAEAAVAAQSGADTDQP